MSKDGKSYESIQRLLWHLELNYIQETQIHELHWFATDINDA